MTHPVQLPVGIACPEVVPPTAKNGSQFRDKQLHVFPAWPLAGDLSHPVWEFLRRLGAWPPLNEITAGAALYAPLLANHTSEEYEALLAAS
jgi:hypothetical protein